MTTNLTASKDKPRQFAYLGLSRSLLGLISVIMNNSVAIPDRRSTPRYTLRIPLQLRVWGDDGPKHGVESIDLSGRGALLETDLPLRIGAAVELRLKLPEEITGQPTTEWRCRGRVVRVAQGILSNSQPRVGVCFENLEVARL